MSASDQPGNNHITPSVKLAELVARSRHEFVRKSLDESESRTVTVIAKSEHRIRACIAELEHNLRREFSRLNSGRVSFERFSPDRTSYADIDPVLLMRVRHLIQEETLQIESRLRAQIRSEVSAAIDQLLASTPSQVAVNGKATVVRSPLSSKTLQFDEDDELLEAASHSAEGHKRSLRTRVNTGYEYDTKKGLVFDDSAEVLDAASMMTGVGRSIRTRINTGPIKRVDGPGDERNGLQFNQSVEELDAASISSGGNRKSVRSRINTGYAWEKDALKDKRAKGQANQKLFFSHNVEQLDAASFATEGNARSIRTRVNTGFAFEGKDPSPNERKSEEQKELQFNDRAELLNAASFATDGPKRDLRSRILTGFERQVRPTEPAEQRELQFSDDHVVVDAASTASEGPIRSIRTRILTGFERSGCESNGESREIQFENGVEELEAASSASSGPRKSVRSRINTGYAFEKPEPKSLNFHSSVEEVDAASLATEETARSIRTRVSTGYEREVKATADTRKELHFDDRHEELDAASLATDGPKRCVRTRIVTGYAREGETGLEADHTESKGLQFSDDIEELEAASGSAGGSSKAIRTRVNTGFVKQGDAPKDERNGSSSRLQFSDDIEEVDAASSATDGSGKSIRARVNTGFIRPEESPMEECKGLQFADDVEELEAASSSTGGSGKSLRTRVNTGFVKAEDAPQERKGLQFDESIEEVDAASFSTGGSGKSVRTRVNTGFVKQGHEGNKGSSSRLQFNEDVELVDAASVATGGSVNSVRTRVNTGFVRPEDTPKEERKGLQFADDVEEVDAASQATGSSCKSVRTRINTGFVKQGDAPTEERKGLRFTDANEDETKGSSSKCTFNDDIEELDAASFSAGGSGKSVRARVNTGFIRQGETGHINHLHFNEDIEEVDAASFASNSAQSIRGRVNTGFARPDDAPERKGLHFDEAVEELDAASFATGGSGKSVRGRINTGFARPEDAPTEERKGLLFDEAVEELDAASFATGGSGKSVRGRINTGFARPEDAPKEERKGLLFDDAIEEFDAASFATGGSGKSVRGRINTGFARPEDAPTEERRGLLFDEDVEEIAAASVATGGSGKSVKGRVNTGFARPGERRGLQFDDTVEEVDAASIATGSSSKSIRTRVNTGFVKEEKRVSIDGSAYTKNEFVEYFGESDGTRHWDNAQVQFDDHVEEVEAASFASGGQAKSVKTRIHTGFVRPEDQPVEESRGLQFSDDVEEVEAASLATGAGSNVRMRINTGFVKSSDAVQDDGAEEDSRRIKFQDSFEEVDAASPSTPKGPRQSVRRRIATGFIHDDELDEDEQRQPKSTLDISAVTNSLLKVAKERSEGSESSKGVSFNREVTVSDAASVSTGGEGSRKVRSRVNTGYSEKESASSSESDFDDIESDLDDILDVGTIAPPSTSASSCRSSLRSSLASRNSSRRSSIIKRKLSERRMSRQEGRRRSTVDVALVAEKRRLQGVTIGIGHMRGYPELDEDSPEVDIESHRVEDAEKDVLLLKASLKPLTLFEDIEEEALDDLIEEAVHIFEYDDGEEVVRQGDTGGTHFFVVASGEFEIVKNGNVMSEVKLQVGASFGESVLLIDGQRTATVRAKGNSRVYGMEADDVRDVMRVRNELSHKQVRSSIEKIIESERCEQFAKLNAYQLQRLYLESELLVYQSGDVVISEDATSLEHVYVLVQGAVVLRKNGQDQCRVPRFSMFGIRGLLFGDISSSAVADGATKILALSRKLLEALFGSSRMPTVLMRSVVNGALGTMDGLSSQDEEQREAMSNNFRVQALVRGMGFDSHDVRFVMCLHGPIDVSADGFAKDIRRYTGDSNDAVGSEFLLNPNLAWNLQIRSASASPSFIAVWSSATVENAMAQDEAVQKLQCIKNVFLFKTLSPLQLRHLADSMSTQHVAAGNPIITQGEMGDSFYIIGHGRVHVERDSRFIRALSSGDFFGDRALLNSEPRSATITASDNCALWVITSETFKEAMPKASIEYLQGRMSLQDTEYTFSDFQFIRVIGTGGFGVVKMVQLKNGTRYALKCVRKQPVVEFGQQESLINERSVLAGIDHPFIVRLVQSFKNDYFVYFLQELVSGGELLEALTKLNCLDLRQTQFYASSIILAFEHLHERRIAYLDLKSENVLLDAQGFIKIVDFGLAVKIVGGQCHAVKGTPHFMAPEMILSRGYDTTADLWALGICVYEFMIGDLPFGNDLQQKAEIFRAVLKAPLTFPEEFRKKEFSEVAISLIQGLLQRNPNHRLGAGIEGYSGLMGHNFFEGVDWDGVIARNVSPPYVPSRENYNEAVETSRKSLFGRCLEELEMEAEQEERTKGWEDPDPGWDDDFC